MNKLLQLSFGRLGYDYEFLTGINRPAYPDGHLFLGEAEICLALQKAKAGHKRIVVLPDFDMDGISAGTVLYGGLSLMGFTVSIYEPDPSGGYGFRKEDIDAIMEQWPDAAVVLTCDVGVAEGFAVAYAKAMGLQVLVTDHHIEKPGKRVDADAVMDPYRYDEPDGFKGVCGAWVAWRLMTTYARLSGSDATRDLVRRLVLFVGLGSCGDLMPVTNETRSAVKDSVAEFNRLLDAEDMDQYFGCPASMLPEAYAAPFENLRALHGFLIDCGKARPGDVTDETYSFTYCPMFNSVRRMGERMRGVYDMLYKRHAWNSLERLTLFRWLCDLNEGRKKLVQELYGQLADADEQALAPYIYLIDAVPGILGLLAAKLMEHTGRPCLVLRPDPKKGGFSGSGRVPEWMDRGDMLSLDGVTSDGHDRAFGAFVRKDALMAAWGSMDARFRSEQAVQAARQGSAADDPRPVVYVGRDPAGIPCDFAVTSPDGYDTCMDYACEILKFRPFGKGFREPEFVATFRGSDVMGVRAMGSERQHLSLDLGHGVRAVWFGGAGFLDALAAGGPDDAYRLSGTFGLNEFNGSTSLQFMVSGTA